MPRSNSLKTPPTTKKAKDAGPKKRKSRPDHDDDDSSVDSHGNIRDLIVSSEEEEEEDEVSIPTPPIKRRLRKLSDVAEEAPKKSSTKESSTKESSTKESSTKAASKKKESSTKEGPSKREAAVLAEKKIKRKLAREAELRKAVSESETSTEDYSVSESDSEDLDELSSEDQPSPYLEEDDDGETLGSQDTDEDDEDKPARRSGNAIELLISDFAAGYEPPKPKKYKLKKEPENVRRFVKLVQTEVDPDEEDIDRDITYFKGLTPRAQDRLLTKLQHKVEPDESAIPLKFQILAKEVPPEVERVALSKYTALQNIDPSTTEYYKAHQWIHGYTQLPLGTFKDLPVKIEDGAEACQKFVTSVRENMDSAIYGHDEAKLQILQFVSSWIANPAGSGNVLSVHGPPGVGKTTLIKDGVAKALGRPFHFITLGGATDASFLDGHSYTYEGSTWGRIVDCLIKSKCMNPIFYFDELDKVSETPKGEEINNLLIHLTDGSQNDRFQDKYFTGIDLNLSRCLFIFSHNNHEKVNPILRDRMYNIRVEGFNVKQKLVIAESYLVNAALREVNLFEKIGISKEIITHIIEHYTGEEQGVRELKRCIQTVISKLNLLRFYNDPAKVPFAIKGFGLPFTMKREHIELFLKRKEVNESLSQMYV
jgi:flagellar biosynthesis GTPase FlhF